MKILIVEDEIIIREGIAKLLKKLNKEYEIVGEAENGQAGLELARLKRPDLVITDIKMPVMDGLEMLQKIYGEGISPKAIVMSAYSEFEYARTAMKMGVTEYLIKPIMPNAFSQSLENVRYQMEQESMRTADQLGSLELIFQNLLSGALEADCHVLDLMEGRYGVKTEDPISNLCVYLGREFEQMASREKRALARLCQEQDQAEFCILESSYHQSLICVFYNYEDGNRLGRWIQRIADRKKPGMGFGWVQSEQIGGLKADFEKLFSYMEWNLLFDDMVLSYPQITFVQTVPCTYPFDLEKRMKTAICAGDWKNVHRAIEDFQKYFQSGKVYEPKEMKECYVRFLWAVIGISKEIGCLDHKNLKQAQLLELIMGAKTRRELSDAVEFVKKNLRNPKEEEETVTHLTVKRAKEMIHEYYQSGITLDEIASSLNITPEYLGTCFHREMGINFSSYIRNYRMDKAKELLCKTHLKLYEIAEQVGYANPKYFSQVFKEYTGQLPLEYRKSYK